MVSTTLTLNDASWHHVCVTWQSDGGQWKVYVDGFLLKYGTGLATGTYIVGGGHLILGIILYAYYTTHQSHLIVDTIVAYPILLHNILKAKTISYAYNFNQMIG